MEEILLEIGCTQEKIWLKRYLVYPDLYLYKVEWQESQRFGNGESLCFFNLNDAWVGFKMLFPKWYQLSVFKIDCQMAELLKDDYFYALVKENAELETWLIHLIGYSIGF